MPPGYRCLTVKGSVLIKPYVNGYAVPPFVIPNLRYVSIRAVDARRSASQGLAGYIVRRLLLAPVILLFVSIVTFALGRFAPSDYVEIQAGPQARPETIERIREARGLNDPVYEQYGRYMGMFLQRRLRRQREISRAARLRTSSCRACG